MNYRTLRLKIITGYAYLAIVLVFAAQMVYDSTRSLTDLNNASERLMERRNVVDSLVYSMLDAANAERSVMMGDRAAKGSSRMIKGATECNRIYTMRYLYCPPDSWPTRSDFICCISGSVVASLVSTSMRSSVATRNGLGTQAV